MKQKYKTIGARFALLIIICILFLPTLIGCGFVSGSDGTEGGSVSNYLCFKDDTGPDAPNVYTYTSTVNATKTKLVVLAFNNISNDGRIKQGNYKSGSVMLPINPGDGATSIVHALSSVLYKSLFNKDVSDHGLYKNLKFSGISLAPSNIIQKTNEKTLEALTSSQNESFMDSVIGFCAGVAGGIFVIVWCLNFLNQIINERFTMEAALKGFMQLILGLAVAFNAKYFVSAFVWAGNALSDKVFKLSLSATTGFSEFATEMDNQIVNHIITISLGGKLAGIKIAAGTLWLDWGSFFALILMAIPFAGEVICAYQIVSQLITRLLELFVRISISPIPIMMSAQSGFTAEMLRFFKSTLACAIQPVLMFVGVALYNSICDIVSEVFTAGQGMDTGLLGSSGLFAAVAMAISFFILAAYMGKTRQLASEIVGH